eukprot:1191481-Prorocentrum_minimum.AAC.1
MTRRSPKRYTSFNRNSTIALDAKGYSVDAKGYSVDAKRYSVDAKGYSVDAKGSPAASPGVDGQKGLRLQFNSRQSSTVDTSIAFSARHFEYSIEYSIEYSTYVPCRQTAIGWLRVDSGACPAGLWR